MDREKIRQNYRICWGLIIILFLLIFPSSVFAQEWEWNIGDSCMWVVSPLLDPACSGNGILISANYPESWSWTFMENGLLEEFSDYDISVETTCPTLEIFDRVEENRYIIDFRDIWASDDCFVTQVILYESRLRSFYEQSLPPNDAVHVNDAGIMSGELPMPLPRLPGSVTMPDIAFPYVDFSEWPSVTDGRESVGSTINGELYLARDVINAQYDRARDGINAVRETTQSIRDFVGNPMTSVTAQSDSRIVSVNSMASEMAQSVSYSLGYLRAVSNLGPMGLDLVFIFIGLGWVLFMNVVEWIMAVIVWLLKMLAGAITFAFRILELVMELIRTIRALILI